MQVKSPGDIDENVSHKKLGQLVYKIHSPKAPCIPRSRHFALFRYKAGQPYFSVNTSSQNSVSEHRQNDSKEQPEIQNEIAEIGRNCGKFTKISPFKD